MTIPDRSLHDLVIRVRLLEAQLRNLEAATATQGQTLTLVIDNMADVMITEDGDGIYTEDSLPLMVESGTILEGNQLTFLTTEDGDRLITEDGSEIVGEESFIQGSATVGDAVLGVTSDMRDQTNQYS